MSFIYLASPYSHADPAIREARYRAAVKYVAKLSRAGVTVYSPVVHYHCVAADHKLPTDAAFWRRHNGRMLFAAHELRILRLDGWRESKGVAQELEWARGIEIPVTYEDA